MLEKNKTENQVKTETLLNDYANAMAINKVLTLLELYRLKGKEEFETFEKYVDVICAQYYGSAYEPVVNDIRKRLRKNKEKGG